ncbi:MAG: ABC transporter ATP-binding protein [Thermoanaerobaculia bacterium]|nr:ABC transporter ATP-binding protein [Thermoanaerobaculia bacterium]
MSNPASSTVGPLFELREVSFRYEEIVAIDACSLVLERGTRVALLGANGSGKSTLLLLLDALQPPSSGTIRFDGRELTPEALLDERANHEFRRRVGFVFQNPEVQLFNPTVRDEIAFGPLQLGWPTERIRDEVERMVDRMQLRAVVERPTFRLSMGEKKRVAIASVLILDPEVILLDEPTAGLDPRSQSGVIDLLEQWQGTARTVIVATHDLGVIEEIADRCLVFQQGRLVADRPPAEIVRDLDLLTSTGLVHSHRHSHGPGVHHSHPHLHRHQHGES